MRFTEQVSFLKKGEEKYDPDSSTYVPGEDLKQTFLANISDMGLKRSMEIFGDYRVDRKVVRLLNSFKGEFDIIELEGKRYRFTVDKQDKTVFYVEGA